MIDNYERFSYFLGAISFTHQYRRHRRPSVGVEKYSYSCTKLKDEQNRLSGIFLIPETDHIYSYFLCQKDRKHQNYVQRTRIITQGGRQESGGLPLDEMCSSYTTKSENMLGYRKPSGLQNCSSILSHFFYLTLGCMFSVFIGGGRNH